DFSTNPINAEHAELGIPPIEEAVSHPGEHPILRIFAWAAGFMLVAAVAYLALRLIDHSNGVANAQDLILGVLQSKVFWSAVAVGVLRRPSMAPSAWLTAS